MRAPGILRWCLHFSGCLRRDSGLLVVYLLLAGDAAQMFARLVRILICGEGVAMDLHTSRSLRSITGLNLISPKKFTRRIIQLIVIYLS